LLHRNPEPVQLLAFEFELHKFAVFFTQHDRFAFVKKRDKGRCIFRRVQRRFGRNLPFDGPQKRGVREGEARCGDGSRVGTLSAKKYQSLFFHGTQSSCRLPLVHELGAGYDLSTWRSK